MLKYRKVLGLLLGTLITVSAYAQGRYWIYFDSKEADENVQYVSDQTLRNRAALGIKRFQYSDVPVTDHYINSLRKCGAQVISQSKWLNAAMVSVKEDHLDAIHQMDFVREVALSRSSMFATRLDHEVDFYTYAMEQMEATTLLDNNLGGKGVSIGIIDGNFYTSDRSPALRPLFESGHVRATRDFVEPDAKEFFNNADDESDHHGTTVWHLVGGYDSARNMQYGLAKNALYYLARTDDTFREYRSEEGYWIAALEWMDSLGVRLVNSSLGYATDFDDKEENYRPENMNGHTTAITRAAQVAAEEKGMIVVVSAGNRGGDKGWRVVSAPADAKGVITVGATDITRLKEKYSAIRPPSLS